MCLEISQNSQENTWARVLFKIKFITLFKKKALAQVFSCEFCEIFKNTFFNRTPTVAASRYLLLKVQTYFKLLFSIQSSYWFLYNALTTELTRLGEPHFCNQQIQNVHLISILISPCVDAIIATSFTCKVNMKNILTGNATLFRNNSIIPVEVIVINATVAMYSLNESVRHL